MRGWGAGADVAGAVVIGGCHRVDHAAPAAQVIPGRGWTGRVAARGAVLLACCFGLMAVFWLLSGTSAHAATASRADVAAPSSTAPSSTTPASSGGLLGAVTNEIGRAHV